MRFSTYCSWLYLWLCTATLRGALIAEKDVSLTRSLPGATSENQVRSFLEPTAFSSLERTNRYTDRPTSSRSIRRTYSFLWEKNKYAKQIGPLDKVLRFNWRKDIGDAFLRLCNFIPYSLVYFDIVDEVLQATTSDAVKNFAHYMPVLKSVLLPAYKLFDNTKPADYANVIIKSIHLGLTALEDSPLMVKERYCVLGILECLKYIAPKISKDHIHTLEDKFKISRGELELYLIGGKIHAKKIREIWENPDKDHLNNDMVEVIERVELLHRWFVESEMTSGPFLIPEMKRIHDQLLMTELPLKQEHFESFIKDIIYVIIDPEVPHNQKIFTHELCWHFHKHNKIFQERFNYLLSTNEEFQSLDINSHIGKMLSPFGDVDRMTTLQMNNAWTDRKSLILNREEKMKSLRVFIAASTFNDLAWDVIMQDLYKNPILPWELVELGIHFNMDPNYSGASLIDPGLLNAAQRSQYIRKGLLTQGRRLTRAEVLMCNIPWMESSDVGKSLKVFEAMIHQISEHYQSEKEVQVMDFESLYHIYKTSPKEIDFGLQQHIQEDTILSRHLRDISNNILTGAVQTSGVAEVCVRKFAERIKSECVKDLLEHFSKAQIFQ
ncbi:hypothetical protein DFH28DRAFT_950982 [Melampsora americana]|nr:hypothetical protein DFH28DRAFT_950982 [Melampsora americana]